MIVFILLCFIIAAIPLWLVGLIIFAERRWLIVLFAQTKQTGYKSHRMVTENVTLTRL